MEKSENIDKREKIGQEQVYDLLTSRGLSWQAILYDLINTEQLDPWDIDLAKISNKYLEKIRELEEANFFISSKVLLAATILLRIKSEILLDKHIKGLDEILFGKKEEVEKSKEIIEIDEDELPLLYPKTPLPRMKKVSIQELISALDKAISTESRRIKKEVLVKKLRKDTEIVLPKMKINIKDRIRKLYSQVLTLFKRKKTCLSYSELIGRDKEERLASFLPILHLNNQEKLFLEQEEHFSEIWIWLYKHYKKQEYAISETKIKVQNKKEEIIEKAGFENPLANFFDSASEIIKGNLDFI